MKKTLIAGLVALSMGISAQAFAKDIAPVDVLVGDFAGIASIDFDKLIANKMIGDAISKNEDSIKDEIALLKEGGIDYKKDIDTVVIAMTDKSKACAVVDSKKSLTELYPKLMEKSQKAEYKGLALYSDESTSSVLVSDTRIIVCDKGIDIKPSIDNALSEKPKTLKDRNSTLADMYNKASSQADIRIAGKMTKKLQKDSATYQLDGADGKALKVSDIEAGSISISFAKGLDVNALAKMKSDAAATDGAAILNTTLDGVLSDPSLKDMGLDFLAKAIKVSSDKKNLKGNVKLTDAQLTTIVTMLTAMSEPQQ